MPIAVTVLLRANGQIPGRILSRYCAILVNKTIPTERDTGRYAADLAKYCRMRTRKNRNTVNSCALELINMVCRNRLHHLPTAGIRRCFHCVVVCIVRF